MSFSPLFFSSFKYSEFEYGNEIIHVPKFEYIKRWGVNGYNACCMKKGNRDCSRQKQKKISAFRPYIPLEMQKKISAFRPYIPLEI